MAMDIVLPLKVGDFTKIIPHRDPFLFVDEVTAFSDREFIEGWKKLSGAEAFFKGHFPGNPIMPGVLIVEALAQLGVIFARVCTGGLAAEDLLVFAGCDDIRFRKQVLPRDRLDLRMDFRKEKFGNWWMQGKATVGGEIVAEGMFISAIVRGANKQPPPVVRS